MKYVINAANRVTVVAGTILCIRVGMCVDPQPKI
jgi:hypothetical protein